MRSLLTFQSLIDHLSMCKSAGTIVQGLRCHMYTLDISRRSTWHMCTTPFSWRASDVHQPYHWQLQEPHRCPRSPSLPASPAAHEEQTMHICCPNTGNRTRERDRLNVRTASGRLRIYRNNCVHNSTPCTPRCAPFLRKIVVP